MTALLALPFALLIACGIWYIIFLSPLVIHLLAWKRPEGTFNTHYDVGDWLLAQRRFFLHGVWTCIYCQGFWTAVLASAVSLALMLHPDYVLWFPLLILAYIPPVRILQKLL